MRIHLDVRLVCTSFWNWNLAGVFPLCALSEYVPFSFLRTRKAAIISFTWSNISILGKSKANAFYVHMISNLLSNFTDLSYPRHVKNYFCTRVGRVVSQPLPVRGREIHLELSSKVGHVWNMKMLPSFLECCAYFALVLHFSRFFAGLSRL